MMTNPKGSRFEKELLDYLRSMGYETERLRTTGSQDEGDLLVRALAGERRFVVEAKNTAKMDLSGWVGEAELEKDHYLQHRGLAYANFVVVHKRRNKGVGQAYVTMPLFEWLEQIR